MWIHFRQVSDSRFCLSLVEDDIVKEYSQAVVRSGWVTSDQGMLVCFFSVMVIFLAWLRVKKFVCMVVLQQWATFLETRLTEVPKGVGVSVLLLIEDSLALLLKVQAYESTMAKSEKLKIAICWYWEGEGCAWPLPKVNDHQTAVLMKENQYFTLTHQFKTISRLI